MNDQEPDDIDLGAASIETKGPMGPLLDIGLGKIEPGLADD